MSRFFSFKAVSGIALTAISIHTYDRYLLNRERIAQCSAETNSAFVFIKPQANTRAGNIFFTVPKNGIV